MMKKLSLLFVLMLLPMVASADTVEIDGIYYNVIKKAEKAEVAQSPIGYYNDVVIPESIEYEGVTCKVTSIGENAFANAAAMTSITIPSTVTEIGRGAFHGCTGLTSIELPINVTSLGEEAFRGCKNIATVSIPKSVGHIGFYAFKGCSNLTSIQIEDLEAWCAIEFETSAFDNYHSLIVAGEKITSLVIPEGVESIGDDAFGYCQDIISVSIPASVKEIGYATFSNCINMAELTFADGIQIIGDFSFEYCQSLKSLKIPSTVTIIGDRAFQYCKELTDVYCFALETPDTKNTSIIDARPFNDCDIEYATLHVPSSSVEEYQKNRPWCYFGSIVSLTDDDTAIRMQTIEENNIVRYVNLEGKQVSQPIKGVNIVVLKNGVTKKILKK